MPQMLRDVVREVLGGQPDMAIVGETPSDEELLADVVIMPLDGDRLTEWGIRVLYERRTRKVLGLSTDGRTAALFELHPQRTTLVEVSPEGLRAAIRSAG
jgi:hypothetical protein